MLRQGTRPWTRFRPAGRPDASRWWPVLRPVLTGLRAGLLWRQAGSGAGPGRAEGRPGSFVAFFFFRLALLLAFFLGLLLTIFFIFLDLFLLIFSTPL